MSDDKNGFWDTEEELKTSGASAIPVQTIVMPLILKKKWFDIILSGEKTEEYREIKDHWARRFLYTTNPCGIEFSVWDEMLTDMARPFDRHKCPHELMKYFDVRFKEFDVIHFRNGYRKDAPQFFMKFEGFKIDRGSVKNGAKPGKFYFVLKLGKHLGGAIV